MKNNLINNFVLHLALEQGYKGDYDEEAIKSFITEKFGVVWSISDKYKKCPYQATFKSDPDKVHRFDIYAKSQNYLIETVLFRIKLGDWKRE